MKNNMHDFTVKKLLSVKSSMLFFIQTLPRILCACAISRVTFLDLFGPIAGVTNPIMESLLQRIAKSKTKQKQTNKNRKNKIITKPKQNETKQGNKTKQTNSKETKIKLFFFFNLECDFAFPVLLLLFSQDSEGVHEAVQ